MAMYLLFVLKIGPNVMKHRMPLELSSVLPVYNAVQVGLSAYLAYRILTHIWFYFIAKVTELLDTVFIILRKKEKQVSFLHIYHHSLMMLGSWAFLKYAPSENVIFSGFLNCVVHVVMYSYYGLAALGPRVAPYLWWKKYITTFQIIQFVTLAVHFPASLLLTACPPPRAVGVFITMNLLFFMYLFGDFYRKCYSGKRRKSEGGEEKSVGEERKVLALSGNVCTPQ
ncbi:hypothetical protein JYU34_012713 [Plutella xylostella]|uniref:Elongation of very long chain fatty acids protein n=1 Tax=Plutella xylostella TaxID=51655 RepID=A0ABQ7QBZ0_PLUXY|nr:hypothetical protein JYU34_012713 [Plutella xylostella]